MDNLHGSILFVIKISTLPLLQRISTVTIHLCRPEPLVLEFPEMTSSTRRNMWLTLIREVIFLHRFISMYSVDSPIHKWEVHSRIILGVIRLHAAREMLRMSPPPPSSFLVFSLYDELPKGDFVLEQLANNLKETSTITPLSASHVFKGLSKSHRVALSAEIAKEHDKDSNSHEQPLASLENTIGQVRDEAREVTVANVAIEGMKEEGITDSLLVLVVCTFLLYSLWYFICSNHFYLSRIDLIKLPFNGSKF